MPFLSIMLVVTLSGCGNTDKSSGNNSSGNIAGDSKNITTKDAHVSDNTLSLSRDDVADGEEEVRKWAESLGLKTESSEPESSGDTVGTSAADPKNQQTLYLWEEGNAPATTEYTENNGNYADGFLNMQSG